VPQPGAVPTRVLPVTPVRRSGLGIRVLRAIPAHRSVELATLVLPVTPVRQSGLGIRVLRAIPAHRSAPATPVLPVTPAHRSVELATLARPDEQIAASPPLISSR